MSVHTRIRVILSSLSYPPLPPLQQHVYINMCVEDKLLSSLNYYLMRDWYILLVISGATFPLMHISIMFSPEFVDKLVRV